MTTQTTQPQQPPADKNRYRKTLNLPQTKFDMKANLLQNEPISLARWQKSGLYAKIRAARKGSPVFVFHDGPPYANGSIHLGHLMNKCLKDFVVRSRTMMGFDVPYVPGWDCHGLPIEHKVMTELVAAGKTDKLKAMDPGQRAVIVRKECQKHADKYIKLQSGQMQRLLTLADYDNPYLTMLPQYEADTLEVLATLLERGVVYRAKKPVHWSIANETALAEAELEYEEREDLSVYVDFEAEDAEKVYDAFGLPAQHEELDQTQAEGQEQKSRAPRAGVRPHQRPCFMIWTTTPWTLPANLAIAVSAELEYALVFIDGNITVMASNAVDRVSKLTKAQDVAVLATTLGKNLAGLRYRHPFVDPSKEGVAALPADERGATTPFFITTAEYVTAEDGTGLVHTAPGHGVEDYQTGLREKLAVYSPVRGDGTYDNTVPAWLRGMSVWEANAKIVQHLRTSGHLFFDQKFTHSYPHDWRSKTPVIFRCTEQWFVSVDKPLAGGGSLKQRALDATAQDVGFVPEWGRNRMRGMLESRPDWCISRQRSWGLPIPSLLLPDGSAFMTAASCRAVIRVVREKGSDAWFQLQPAELLAHYDWKTDPDLTHAQRHLFSSADFSFPASLRKGSDILDVWFESGSSWNSVLRARGLGFPSELYLEGSDQHRGWFQLSLLPALGVTGQPPFKTLLTHGFMVDKDGRKLSKSRPDAARYEVDSLTQEFGVDVMRWWVSSLAYENDVKVDLEFFSLAGESYRKVRNTLKFMLSNLADFTPACAGNDGHCVALADFPPTSIDAWVLAEFDNLVKTVTTAFAAYDFRTAHLAIFHFCNQTLSATYLAAVKDRLYCDKPDAPRRRRTQTALWDLTDGLCRLLAPFLPHTADEAFRSLRKVPPNDNSTCVHLETFPGKPGAWGAPVQADARWNRVIQSLEPAQVALEQAKSKGIENPLDAGLRLPDPEGLYQGFDPVDIADLLGVSQVRFDPGLKTPVVTDLRDHPRCERSWKRDGTVKQRSDGGMLTDRDAIAVGVA